MVKKKLRKKTQEHIHIWDIPKKYFPRNSKGKEYAKDLVNTTSSLFSTNKKVQYSAQLCSFNISFITRKSGFTPYRPDVFDQIEDFTYHYENYCYRLYVYREKLLQFINSIIPIGYEEREVRIQHILINPIIKQIGILPLLMKFKKNKPLSTVISDRKNLTHLRYYGDKFDEYFRPIRPESKTPEEFEKWCKDWEKQIASRAQLANKCSEIVSEFNNSIAKKIIDYKNKIHN